MIGVMFIALVMPATLAVLHGAYGWGLALLVPVLSLRVKTGAAATATAETRERS